MSTVSYKDAGVDIDAGNQFVENIKPLVKSTFDKKTSLAVLALLRVRMNFQRVIKNRLF